jgi:hypothetical protein
MHGARQSGRRRSFAGGLLGLLTILAVWQAPTVHGRDYRDDVVESLGVIGLTGNGQLVRFRADSPRRTRSIGYVAGLMGSDTALVGIDFRPQDGKLYALGNGGGVYTNDTNTGAAAYVNSLTVALAGQNFGVDFNPAADRLRIVSDIGQNLAHNVNDGGTTVENSSLTYTAPPAMPVAATGISGAAYTNNDVDMPSTGTTLFDLDTNLDQVVIQSPPGVGILVATGQLGVDATAVAGFDIYSDRSAGVTRDNFAVAALQVNGKYGFYRINLTTGRATSLGAFHDAVVDIAVALKP